MWKQRGGVLIGGIADLASTFLLDTTKWTGSRPNILWMAFCIQSTALPKSRTNMSGVLAALELRAEVGYLARPIPPVEKYVDQSCYQNAVSTERSVAE